MLGDMVDVGFAHPFPRELPEVTLERLDDAAAETDMRELRWHFIVPEPGEEALWAIYDHPPLNLTSITRQVVTGPARVHDVEVIPPSATLSGDTNRLVAIGTVTTDPINISGATGNVSRTVRIRMPAGVTLAGSQRVQVNIRIE